MSTHYLPYGDALWKEGEKAPQPFISAAEKWWKSISGRNWFIFFFNNFWGVLPFQGFWRALLATAIVQQTSLQGSRILFESDFDLLTFLGSTLSHGHEKSILHFDKIPIGWQNSADVQSDPSSFSPHIDCLFKLVSDYDINVNISTVFCQSIQDLTFLCSSEF